MTRTTADRSLTVVRAADLTLPDEPTPAWLVEHLWTSRAVGVIGGAPKSCKSWLALELAVAVASARPCLGRFAVPEPGSVLLYAAEDTPLQVRERIEQLCHARGASFHSLELDLILEPALRIDRVEHVERLRATLEERRQPASSIRARMSSSAALSFPQRFGNSLNPHYHITSHHFHVLAVDGVLSEAPPAEANAVTDGPADVRFYEATRLAAHSEELARLAQYRVFARSVGEGSLRTAPRPTCSRGRGPAGSAWTPRCESRQTTGPASSGSCATARGDLSLSSACMHPGEPPPSPHRTPSSSTSPGPGPERTHRVLAQWVLSVPKRLRPYLHHDTEVAGAVLRITYPLRLRAVRIEATEPKSSSP